MWQGHFSPSAPPHPTHPVHPPSPSRSSCSPPPFACCLMASIAGSAVSFAKPVKAINTNSLSFSGPRRGNAFLRLQPVPMRFAVCCSAKQDTVEKVCEIVKKQLAVPEGTEVCGTTKFSDLGADSLDTVEIVMGLEEEFQISVEETSAQAIATVEDAATLIDKLVSAKSS
ncbi:hypothetical protein CFC21_109153 [Triticum aestivum]|uniref:Acyl carrier protein n=2 Tax=Triticum aestivum TaxID=4565 RepID=A0A3B6TEK1_WHEAT|nr:acyl carrier protein 3, chloroplastic-like [Triticum aestivum]KAF7108747.1 hypothetical protein CFC21_109153 [Triticum aestivum]